MRYDALVLNADYRPLSYMPLSLWPWEQAVHAMFRGRVDVVAEYDKTIRSPNFEMRLPSVVALKSYKPPKREATFTRFNVFLRDDFRCQYCLQRFRPEDLTFDHVKPRKLGGRTSWENVCAACRTCNSLKGDKLIMQPTRKPFRPAQAQLIELGRKFPPRYLHDSWQDYLYWDSELESG